MPDDTTLSPEEAAAYLKVNPQTIYRNLRQGRLPGGKVGRQWRIRRSDLDRSLGGASLAGEGALAWRASPEAATDAEVAKARAALLEAELMRFVRVVVERLLPLKILVYGSFAAGTVGEWSDLDIVVIAETDLPFYARSKAILTAVRPRVGLDILVYTPAEWRQIKDKPFVKGEILGRGRVVYERGE